MKRVEAIIRDDRLRTVVDALKEAGVGGLTVSKSQGRGSGERPTVRGARGTASYTAEYNPTYSLMTVVDDSKVDSVASAIMNAASTSTKGDGKIFVTEVVQAYDIAEKEKVSGTV